MFIDFKIKKLIIFKCGLMLFNWLVKVVMVEYEVDSNMFLSVVYVCLYLIWVKGGWGMVMIGEVDEEYLVKVYGIVIEYYCQVM